MIEISYKKFGFLAPSIICIFLFLFCNAVISSGDVVSSIELKLLWERKVDFDYDVISISPDFGRFIASGIISDNQDKYVLLDSRCQKKEELVSSKLSAISDSEDSLEHQENSIEKKERTLPSLMAEVDSRIVYSENIQYIGIFQTYFDKDSGKFGRRFRFFELGPDCAREKLWEVDPICSSMHDKKSSLDTTKSKDCCFDDGKIADNGNVMLIAGGDRDGKANRLAIYNKSGAIIEEIGDCSQPLPPLGFSMNKFGGFKFSDWKSDSLGVTTRYFDPDGVEIAENAFRLNSEPFDITAMPFWTRSQKDGIISSHYFVAEGEKKVLYIKAESFSGQYLNLYSLDRAEQVWSIENKRKGYEFTSISATNSGDLFLVVGKLKWDRKKWDLDTYQNKLTTNPLELIFVNGIGEVIHRVDTFPGADSVKLSSDGKKLFLHDSFGNFKMYSIESSR
ncbi:hypothetical protein JW979_01740 [bacterium]|nr:hypothetical protein [candidate division CSSED10-310 bacterium]